MGKELDKDYYDKVFEKGGHNQLYFKKAEDIKEYYTSWKMAYDFIIKNKINKIVDLGCGPGHFPSLFKDSDNINYDGYDFSEVAINQAKKLIGEKNNKVNFYIKDLKEISFNDNQNFFVSFEFLEHISFDLEILNKLKPKSQIIFSVPSYDSAGHVRYFLNESEVENRYGRILNLNIISKINNGPNHKIFLYHGIKK